jgi:hypothetical protein
MIVAAKYNKVVFQSAKRNGQSGGRWNEGADGEWRCYQSERT